MINKVNVADRVNYRADAKRFTHRRCKKLTSCQFLDGAKNNIMTKILAKSYRASQCFRDHDPVLLYFFSIITLLSKTNIRTYIAS